ncbi:MAG: alpha-ribazole phosphatase [Pseudomonadota bacterium]
MLIHLIRHTTPDIAAGICYGQADIPLTANFAAEKDQVLTKLHGHYDALFCSPLSRCQLLAEHVSAGARFTEPRLLEYAFGDWELKPWSELRSPDTQAWMDDFVNVPAPNGESILMMQERVDEFFVELLQHDYDTVALVTHSGVQRLLHARILHTPLQHLFRLQLPFGAVIEVVHNQENQLQTVRHL